MKKLKIIIPAFVILIALGFLILYMYWGEAKSEVKELKITEVSQKIESETGVELNDINELKGIYSTYDIDSSTSELMFSLDALQGTVGKFKKFKVEYKSSENEKSIRVDIDPSSIYTALSIRDESLLEEGFFEVNKFPEITFVSEEINFNDSSYIANGTISMMGVDTDFKVPFTYKGKSVNYKGSEVAIFEGKFSLDRTKLGMEHTASVGDEVSVNFIVQLEKQNE